MRNSPGGYGKDLAADLLADLTRPLPIDRLPEPPNPPTALDSGRAGGPGLARSRGPALEGFLRISPLDWRKPCLSIGSQSATIRSGPVHAELRIRIG